MTPSRPLLGPVVALRALLLELPRKVTHVDASAAVLAELEQELGVRGPSALAELISVPVRLDWSLGGRIVRLHFEDGSTRDAAV